MQGEYLLTQIYYFAFLQALFLLIVVLVSARKRKQVNVYLVILIVLLMLGLVAKIGGDSFGWSRQWKGFSEFAVPFFGPTLYLFITSSLSVKKLNIKDLIHYIPGIFYCSVISVYYIYAPKEVITDRIISGELIRFVRIMVALGLTINISYFVLAWMKYKELKALLQNERSYLVNVRFVEHLLKASACCFVIWVFIYLMSYGQNEYLEIYSRPFIWLAIALIILFLAYYQMMAPHVFQFELEKEEVKYANSKFSKADLDRLKHDLEVIMREKEPFLNPKLLKSDLAEMLRINSPELSRLLNERIGMSFFEYVNYYRIHKFISLAQSPLIEQKTMLALAQEAGFNSKSAFNKSFKIVMGCPPSDYLKNV